MNNANHGLSNQPLKRLKAFDNPAQGNALRTENAKRLSPERAKYRCKPLK